MTKDTTIILFRLPSSVIGPLTEIACDGSRRMLMAALKLEADGLVAKFSDDLLADGLRAFAPFIFTQQRRACLGVEPQIIRMARLVWVCSDSHRSQAPALWGPIALAIVPNPIPDWTMTKGRQKVFPSNEVVFVGYLSYPLNQSAIEILCKDMIARFRRFVPSAQLHVCGRRPRRRVAALVRSSGHRLTPNAVHLAEAYTTAAALAIPLHEGGGTRLKVLEAMAIECPIVATAKAVERLGLTPKVHYREAENPCDLAKEIAEVLVAPNFAAHIASGALQFKVENYGQETRLKAAITALAAGGFPVSSRP